MIRVHTATTRARVREFLHHAQKPYQTEEELEEPPPPPAPAAPAVPKPFSVATRPTAKPKLKPKPRKDSSTMTESVVWTDQACNTLQVETVSLPVQTDADTSTVVPVFPLQLQALEIQQGQQIQESQKQFRYVLNHLQAIKGEIHAAREGHDQLFRMLKVVQDGVRSGSLARFQHSIRLKDIEERQNQWLFLLCVMVVFLPLTWWFWCWS